MFGFISRLFGIKSKKEKDVEELKPIVRLVSQAYNNLRSLSDDQLREKTAEFRQIISDSWADVREKIEQANEKAASLRLANDIAGQEEVFRQIDELKKVRNKKIEDTLSQLMPEAFAVVKETCRRLVENQQLVVTATDWDKMLAKKNKHIRIENDKAIWSNTWTVTNHLTKWNMIHYDVQLMGGAVLHKGKIAEMATGEGKTLVATLPVYLNALTGLGVHVVTVNDYLARRDREWNGPIFEFHGLSVDCIDIHEPNSDARRDAYLADITYGTNNEFGFDYLRDNMVMHPTHLVQREHHYAIIDEVDSVLIDEARTPLIISGPASNGDRHEYEALKPRVEKLYNEQKRIINHYITTAREALQKKDLETAGISLLRCQRGLPKARPVVKLMSEEGNKALQLKTEAYYMQDNSKKMHIVDEELCFTIDERNNQIELTERGRKYITQASEDPNLFVLPDIATELALLDADIEISEEEKQQKREEAMRRFAEHSERLHAIHQLLKAYALFENGVEYIIQDNKVCIVDEHTGRVLHGRRYSDGLHQAIEAKENVKVEALTMTYATVTLQNYFRMYHKLAGMTGTAETEASEFFSIYKLDVVVIPTNKPMIRKDLDDVVYKTKREKYNAVIDTIINLQQAGRPILVGTVSVEVSETLSRLLQIRGIKHQVLNARQHQKEAEIIAEAGKAGTVTIATNMAGRGTDIKLGEGVAQNGGLAIIGSERHESRRIDRQLRGRAGRQGDPGSSQFFVSLEDDLMRRFGSERIAKVMDYLKMKEGEAIQHSMITKAITNAQRKVEENNFSIRKRLLEYDDVMNKQREAIYSRRRNALFGDRLQIDLDNMLYELIDKIVTAHYADMNVEGLRMECIRLLTIDPEFSETDFNQFSEEELIEKLYLAGKEVYAFRKERLNQTVLEHTEKLAQKLSKKIDVLEINFTDGLRKIRLFLEFNKIKESQGKIVSEEFEKTVVLSLLDDKWQKHLTDMEDLRQSVQTAVYEQKDPLLIYKQEAFKLFEEMNLELDQSVLSVLFKAEIEGEEEARKALAEPQRSDFSRLKAQQTDFASGNISSTGSPKFDKFPLYNQPEDIEMARAERNANQGGFNRLSRRERRQQERKQQKNKHVKQQPQQEAV
jgi:preprotein translocase subunit SecA